jgi:Glycosyl hydrolases family 25
MTTLLLPDLSEFQPDADMAAIKRLNGGAAIVRACYGASHPDKVFAKHRAAAAAAGFSFLGLYQFARADQDIRDQAMAFCAIVGKLGPHEVPILDLELGTGPQLTRATEWFYVVDQAFGLLSLPLDKRSWLYSGVSYEASHNLGGIFASARHTWVAAYGPTEPTVGHTLWQCTNGTAGVHITDWPGAGKCDTSLYHGTLADLAALIARTPPPGWHTTAGLGSLHDLCVNHGCKPSTVLRLTAAKSPGGVFADNVAAWLNDCADPASAVSLKGVMPAGLDLWLP